MTAPLLGGGVLRDGVSLIYATSYLIVAHDCREGAGGCHKNIARQLERLASVSDYHQISSGVSKSYREMPSDQLEIQHKGSIYERIERQKGSQYVTQDHLLIARRERQPDQMESACIWHSE